MSVAAAIRSRNASDLPGKRDEDWRWTDLRGLIRAVPEPSAKVVGDLPPGPFDALANEVIVVANGRGAAHIDVLPGQSRTVALRILSRGDGSHAARVSISVEAGGSLTLLESYEGEGGYLSQTGLIISLGGGAPLERIVLAADGADGVTVSQAEVDLAPNATMAQTSLTSGARRQRLQTTVRHPGGHADLRLDGVYLLADKRHADLTTVVTHAGVDGVTAQLTKGVVRDQARAVFQGKIIVAEGADQTDARMGHHALILSDRAEVDAKPELEIYADDVACAHGNTVGALDEDALFYAEQRGMPEDLARALLTEAFIGEVIDRIWNEAAREIVRAWAAERLGGLSMAFDAEAVRAEFPILSRQVHGKPLVYLDSAASAQKPRAVIDAMSHAMEHSYANVHRGLHTLANETTDAYEAARAKVAAFINADVNEIVFTKGGTEAVNLVAAGIGARLQAGDEIIVSEMEHHANIVPWHFLRERLGVVLKWVPVTDDGRLDLEAFQTLLGPRTKVVALSHMSNVLGTINDAKSLARMAHEAGALVLFDGCQAIVHKPVDVKDLDADFYVFSGHKLYGPTGIGILYGKADRLAELPPYQGGGEMIGIVTQDEISYADPPHRFEAGTPPILEAIGLGAAIDFVSGLDRLAVAEHEHALYARVRERLAGANWLRVIGDAPGKGAILSFSVDGAHAHDVAQILDRYGVAVRAGTHCAEPLMRRFGVTSSARASFALYNTVEEADAFVDALTKTQAFFA